MPESALLTTAIGTSLTAIAGVVGVAARSWTRKQAEDERTRALVAKLLTERGDDCTERLDAESAARKADRAACEERERALSDRLRTLELHHAVCGLVSVPPVPSSLPTRYPRDQATTPTDAEWRAATRAEREIIERLRNIP
jgi:hypothetical protein